VHFRLTICTTSISVISCCKKIQNGSIVIMALSRVVSELLNVEKCCDLEIRVRGHSRSLKWYHSIDWVFLPISVLQ